MFISLLCYGYLGDGDRSVSVTYHVMLSSTQGAEKNMNQIILRTNKGEYIPGEDVFGVVYLNIEDPTSGHGINLIFKGYEHFSYDYSSEGGKNKLEATKDYIDYYNVEIYNNTEPFSLGNYLFPFKVALPKVLPGTFEANSTNSVTWECIVEYWLQALLTDSDLTAEQTIIVQSKPLLSEEKVLCTNEEHVIRRFPFFKSINFTVSLVEKCPVSGENLKVRLIITNNTNITIRSFRIKLLRNLLFICKKDVPSDKLSPNISRLQQKTFIQAEGGPVVVRETGGSTAGMNPATLNRVLCSVPDVIVVILTCAKGPVWMVIVLWVLNGCLQIIVNTSLVLDNILIPLTTKTGKELPPCIKGQHVECKYGLEIMITLSNQSIVRISHPIQCLLHKNNVSWQSWSVPEWAATGEVIISDSRFSVSHDQLSGEAFSGLPGFQAL